MRFIVRKYSHDISGQDVSALVADGPDSGRVILVADDPESATAGTMWRVGTLEQMRQWGDFPDWTIGVVGDPTRHGCPWVAYDSLPYDDVGFSRGSHFPEYSGQRLLLSRMGVAVREPSDGPRELDTWRLVPFATNRMASLGQPFIHVDRLVGDEDWRPPPGVVVGNDVLTLPPGTTVNAPGESGTSANGTHWGRWMVVGGEYLVAGPAQASRNARRPVAGLCYTVQGKWVPREQYAPGNRLPIRELWYRAEVMPPVRLDREMVTLTPSQVLERRWDGDMFRVPLGGYPLAAPVPLRFDHRSFSRCGCGMVFPGRPVDHSEDHLDFDGNPCQAAIVGKALIWFISTPCQRCARPLWTEKHSWCNSCQALRDHYAVNGVPIEALRFGVEIETANLAWRTTAAEVLRQLPSAWLAKNDASIHSPNGRQAEVITPPLAYPGGLDELILGARRMSQAGARITESCGVHVHGDLTMFSAAQIANMIELWYAVEPTVRACLTPGRTRAHFCTAMDYGAVLRAHEAAEADNLSLMAYTTEENGESRYRMCNMTAYAKHQTVEFRLFNGTLHAGKLRAYAMLVMHHLAWSSKQVWPLPTRDTLPLNHRDAMLAYLDLIGLTCPRARWHLLGSRATEADRPVGAPEPFNDKAKRRK